MKKKKKREECFYHSNFLLPFTLWSDWEVARSLNGSRSIGRNQDSFPALVIGNFLFDFAKSPFRFLFGWSLSKRFQFRTLYFTKTTNWDQLIFLIPCFYNGFSYFYIFVCVTNEHSTPLKPLNFNIKCLGIYLCVFFFNFCTYLKNR